MDQAKQEQKDLKAPSAQEADDEILRGVESEQRGSKAFDDAWTRARKLDEKQGRPYDRHRYARLAHLAKVRVTGECHWASCKEHGKAAMVRNG